jgi:hypothetical protein
MNGFEHFLARLNIIISLLKPKQMKTETLTNIFLRLPSKYDPNVNYDELAWEICYEKHKEESLLKKLKKKIIVK